MLKNNRKWEVLGKVQLRIFKYKLFIDMFLFFRKRVFQVHLQKINHKNHCELTNQRYLSSLDIMCKSAILF